MNIHIDNTEEYDNPALYDQEYNSYLEDVKFLSKWALNTEGVIIEITCGTPLTEECYEMIYVCQKSEQCVTK
jgi:hypothetical protein